MTPDHPAVRRYLDDLGRMLMPLPAEQRAEVLADAREHLDLALAPLGPDPAERDVEIVLVELGWPEAIAAAAFEDAPGSAPTRSASPDTRPLTGTWVAVVVTGGSLVLGLLIVAGTVLHSTLGGVVLLAFFWLPVALFLGVLAAASPLRRGREAWLAGTMVPVATLILSLAVLLRMIVGPGAVWLGLLAAAGYLVVVARRAWRTAGQAALAA